MKDKDIDNNKDFRLPLPSFDTDLNDAHFSETRFNKLIKKLLSSSMHPESIVSIGSTVGDLLCLNEVDFSKLRGVGKTYYSIFIELQSVYQAHIDDATTQVAQQNAAKETFEIDIDNMALCFSELSDKELKSISKLEKSGWPTTVAGILMSSDKDIAATKGFGKLHIQTISKLRLKIENEIKRIKHGEIKYEEFDSALIIPMFKKVTIEELDKILLDDLDKFLDDSDEETVDIFQRRWGFVEPKSTLEELGKKHDVSRERIRQKAVEINKIVLLNLRIKPDSVWACIKDNISTELIIRMPNLGSCFDRETNFYEFMEFISGDRNITDAIRPNLDLNCLNDFFAQNGPASYFEVSEHLEDGGRTDGTSSLNVITYLVEQHRLKIEQNDVIPCYLKKHEAAAYVLSSHPNGLPWQDVSAIVNNGGFSRTELSTERKDHQALFDSEWCFLSDKGVYKHTKYIDFDSIHLEELFDEIFGFIVNSGRNVVHLHEIYKNTSVLKTHDYYVVRYAVKMYGEAYGLYFSGKSQADSVGIEKDFKNVTQIDVILGAMKEKRSPMTKAEVANLLKSNSISHAGFYLDGLMKEGKVVQAERMFYTVPEIAYKDVDVKSMMMRIKQLLEVEGRPVHHSVFKSALNKEFKKSYTKHFYSSLAMRYADEYTIYKRQNLFSIKAIPFSGLSEATESTCNKELSTNLNIERLCAVVAIDRESAQNAIHGWLHNLRQIDI
jgi:hypothetical protein